MKGKRFVKDYVNGWLKRRGYRIALDRTVPSTHWLVHALENAQLKPNTVFDIGVAKGTPWLYDAFAQAKFYLVDPTKESLPHMQTLSRRLNAEIFNVALGEKPGSTEIIIREDADIGASSVFEEYGGHVVAERYSVPIERFDEKFNEFLRPAVCKVDVQGAELGVLRGMGVKLHDLDIIVVETSLIATLRGEAPEFGDVVDFFKSENWVLFDIVGMARRPLDSALAQIDAVFVPAHSPLRTDRRWKPDA